MIDYQKGTINTGTGEHAPVDADGKTVSMYQEISIDTAVKNQKFYFYDLPKYDENGSVVHYSVKEVYAKKTPDGSYQELSLNELKQTGITTEYTSLTSSKYQVGPAAFLSEKQTQRNEEDRLPQAVEGSLSFRKRRPP